MINRFIVAEAEKCIGCRTCEIACAVVHSEGAMTPANFMPRLTVVKSLEITTAVMCHQCDNAPCMHACATNAIIRDKESIQVIQENCIGCKACVVACPFGAMTVVTDEMNSSQALKCDLCAHIPTGPTCVRVCPTDALRMVEAKDLTQMIKEKQQRTAMLNRI